MSYTPKELTSLEQVENVVGLGPKDSARIWPTILVVAGIGWVAFVIGSYQNNSSGYIVLLIASLFGVLFYLQMLFAAFQKYRGACIVQDLYMEGVAKIFQEKLTPHFHFLKDRIQSGCFVVIDKGKSRIVVNDKAANLGELKGVKFLTKHKMPCIELNFRSGDNPVRDVYFHNDEGMRNEYERFINFLEGECAQLGWGSAK